MLKTAEGVEGVLLKAACMKTVCINIGFVEVE